MSLIDIKDDLERIDQLIRLKATNTPAELAKRLNISERNIYRIIKKLKELGCPIYFDKERKSYCYKYEGKLVFKFESEIIDNNLLDKIKGGFFIKAANIFLTDNICQ
jgi:biotin operon repressor